MTIAARSVFEADAERFRQQFQRPAENIADLVEFVGPKSGKSYSGCVLVVTDRAGGSGAEIFAQGVQDTKRGAIVGGQTLGKVLLADSVALPGKFELHLVTADYITVTGKRIEGDGVKPDIALKPDVVGSDTRLRQSLAKILKNKRLSRTVSFFK
jgi:C-terminal processing protease CtpA/Prc